MLTTVFYPQDIAELDKTPLKAKDIKANAEMEAQRPEFRRQAQEWAGLEIRPDAVRTFPLPSSPFVI